MFGARFLIAFFFIVFFNRCESRRTHYPTSKEAVVIPNAYAQLFQISIQNSDSFLDIYGAEKHLIGHYFWGKSEHIDGYIKIRRSQNYVCLSALFARMLHELSLGNAIKAVDNLTYIPQDITLSKSCISLQKTGILHKEALFKLKPQITFTYLLDGSGESEWKRFQNDSHCVIFVQSHLESHPLARAEWIRALGWILGKPQESDSIFTEIQKRYTQLKSQSKKINTPKKVMLNLPFQGIWYIPNREAYFTQLLLDAHLIPVWLQNANDFRGSGATSISMEQAVGYLKETELWLNLGSAKNAKEISEFDERLKPWSVNTPIQYFQPDKLIETSGANAFWDLGALHPEMILSDLIQLQIQESQTPLIFYRKL